MSQPRDAEKRRTRPSRGSESVRRDPVVVRTDRVGAGRIESGSHVVVKTERVGRYTPPPGAVEVKIPAAPSDSRSPVVVKTERVGRSTPPPASMGSPTPIVVETRYVASPATSPIAVRTNAVPLQARPSAPEKVARRAPVAEVFEREERRTKEKKRSRPIRSQERQAEDVRRIRETEEMGMDSKRDRVRAKEAIKKREISTMRRQVKDATLQRKYPKTVDWIRMKRAELSWFSLAVWGILIPMVVLLVVSAASAQIKVSPNGVATKNDSFYFNSSLYPGDTVVGPADNGTFFVLPPLVSELLMLPNAPSFDCGDPSQDLASYKTPVTTGLTFDNQLSVTGTNCSNSVFRVGYCVSGSICSKISGTAAGGVMGSCTTPVGPRRYNVEYVASSFLEAVTVFWYLPLVLLGIAFLVMCLWIQLFASPFLLSFISLLVNGLVYVGWSGGLPKNDNNYFILIYLALSSLLLLSLFRNQQRVTRILRIGAKVMQGRAIDDELTVKEITTHPRSANQIVIPASILALLQLVAGLLLIYMLAYSRTSVNFYPEPVYGPQYTQAGVWVAFGLGVLGALTLDLFPNQVNSLVYRGYAVVQPYKCYMAPILKVIIFACIFIVAFIYISIFFEYAAKYLVSRSVSDWYMYGSKHYRALSRGVDKVGFTSLSLALFYSGGKILQSGFWNTLGTTSASLMIGSRAFFTHLLISPIDAIFYSFVGFLFLGFSKNESRFGLVHGSLSIGPTPTIAAANVLSKELIAKTFGRMFAAVGDSAELRLLAIIGNIFSTGIGLAAWAWMDYLQTVDSVAQLGGYVFLIIWLTGSFISKPSLATTIALLVDFLVPWQMTLPQQMAKNGVMGFVIIASISNSIVRVFLQIPTSATDAAVYCYAMERRGRRRVRSLAIDEMIHKDYLGDYEKIPPGTKLERIVARCPPDGKPGKILVIDVDGAQYNIEIPGGAKPGKDFEVAIPIPLNNLDIPEGTSEEIDDSDDYSEDSEDERYFARAAGEAIPPVNTEGSRIFNESSVQRSTPPSDEDRINPATQTVVQGRTAAQSFNY